MEEKRCKYCGTVENLYSRKRSNKIEVWNICRKCHSELMKKNILKNKDYINKLLQNKMEKQIDIFTNIHMCVDCGEVDNVNLRRDSTRVYNICKKCFSENQSYIEKEKHRKNPLLKLKCIKNLHSRKVSLKIGKKNKGKVPHNKNVKLLYEERITLCMTRNNISYIKAKEHINNIIELKHFRLNNTNNNVSYNELKLFILVTNIFPDAERDKRIVINPNKHTFDKKPDILIEHLKLIIEYDGIRWHQLEKDKKRDKELIEAGYKILHYQGYLPNDQEIRDDIKELLQSNMNYKYKRFMVDITLDIHKVEKYSELSN